MKYLNQFLIIAAVSFIGELLHTLIAFPIPGSVYGLVIMFLLLLSGVLKLEQVENVADWMISIMPVFFIPPTVAIITVIADFSVASIVAIITISMISTVVVMVVTGHTSQVLIRAKKRRKQHE